MRNFPTSRLLFRGIGLLLLTVSLSFAASLVPRRVLVLVSSSAEAYGQAVSGLRETLTGYDLVVVELGNGNPRQTLEENLARFRPETVVAVGSRALNLLDAQEGGANIVATMVLQAETGPASLNRGRQRRSTLSLDVPLPRLLAELKQVVPSRNRLGMIRNPNAPGPLPAALRAEARQAGFSIDIRDCTRPEELLPVFLSFRDQVDLVWCPPDSTLFNSATIKPLILASIRSGLPIVGFSESFVRAGAALGLYPDYQDVGRQTGDLVRRLTDGQADPNGPDTPRLWRLAVNERVVQMLGLRYLQSRAQGAKGLLVVR